MNDFLNKNVNKAIYLILFFCMFQTCQQCSTSNAVGDLYKRTKKLSVEQEAIKQESALRDSSIQIQLSKVDTVNN